MALGLDVVQLFIGLIGGVALFALGRGLRGISRPRLVTRSLAMFVWAMLPVTLALCGAVLLGSRGSTTFGDHLPGTVVSLVTHGFWFMQLHGAFRCLSLTQRGPVPGTVRSSPFPPVARGRRQWPGRGSRTLPMTPANLARRSARPPGSRGPGVSR